MNIPQGPWYIDDLLTFTVVTTVFTTGVATDADAVPSYRVYEDETGSPILTGNMALLDSANTAGFYSEQITLSAANGFEVGKSYSVYVAATVSTVAGATSGGFKVIATPDKTGYALTAAYDAAKTAAQAGNAMTLTAAYDAAKTAAQPSDIPSAATNAAAVQTSAAATPLPSNTKKINNTTVQGTGVTGDLWRG